MYHQAPSTSAFEWDIGIGLGSVTDGDGICRTQVDVPGEQHARVPPYENHFPYGLYSRPLDPTIDAHGNPDPSTANQLLHSMEGGNAHAWPMENPSVLALLPTIKPGETMFHGPLGQFIRGMLDGSFTAFSPAPTGSGQPDVSLSFGSNGFVVSGPWGSFKLDGSGCHIVTAAGASFDLGGIAGLPGPLSALGSSAAINAGTININGNTSIGAGVLGTAPGVNGLFLLAKLTAMDAALKALLATFLTGVAPPFGGPVVFSGLPAATTAVSSSIPASPMLLWTDSNATY